MLVRVNAPPASVFVRVPLPWLHSVTFPIGDSYHPTAAGQSGGYYPVMERLA